jgi:hypothetical protein
LQATVTVDDPGAFNMMSATQALQARRGAADDRIERAENNYDFQLRVADPRSNRPNF